MTKKLIFWRVILTGSACSFEISYYQHVVEYPISEISMYIIVLTKFILINLRPIPNLKQFLE